MIKSKKEQRPIKEQKGPKENNKERAKDPKKSIRVQDESAKGKKRALSLKTPNCPDSATYT